MVSGMVVVACPDSVGGSRVEQWPTRHNFASAKMTLVDDRSPVFQSPIPVTMLVTIVPMVSIDNVTAFLGREEVITHAGVRQR